ncbi:MULTISPECIES: helix-turn-helix domain-containing protein [Chryseobacterium]|uniref:Transcriptional regulator with XRE-family HTH domain n=1 Tax=Chryseobacterium camelliae TaxID=1265445 RepID=A0ABU0TKX9_9FLAO|nr:MULTISPECIES: helix-turn-helix transcriptional regulator [Chryseobacterium]MDT3408441.1 transcriptional regulator with XRE-family HTH domain [Pseudacidovorax intermedius]MDQ1097704.1 transcriptional regulator with XRE-family HTH domain [Chryseobacterium camelliae]MDQ1101635.1 transcriptional regulator with XRE-family HTH domain [Chryseobacterium sp. SORGH_AS_1048]MDR6085076.1 transcriptional regulator with XRE-family HTH domain [Chryseobacterium sp. SORGH_AS_0909]MDR6129431.1 transcriptiona
MNNIGFNIRKIRESKGFSQEYMANVLDISQASYARLENEDTKVTVDRLHKIAEILETSIIDFFDTDKITIQNQNNYDHSNGVVQNMTVESKEVYEKLLQSKDDQISLLTKMIDKFLKS